MVTSLNNNYKADHISIKIPEFINGRKADVKKSKLALIVKLNPKISKQLKV